jgi:hypothetical protein
MSRSPEVASPPRWAEALLRLSLRARDRDSVTGDLLEEYREVVLSSRSRRRAQVWYLRQALSLIDGAFLGLVLGTCGGVWNLVVGPVRIESGRTPEALLVLYGPLLAACGTASFIAVWRGGRIIDAVRVGTNVAFVTVFVCCLAILVRVNVFLATVSLSAFANYEFIVYAPLTLFAHTVIGATIGFIGGLAALAGRGQRQVPQ